MADKPTTDKQEAFQIPKELLAAQQKFLPTGQIYAQFAEAMRNLAQANATYMQELMQANATVLAAFMERPAVETEERPSDAARRPSRAA